jgi:hypothetical protein
MDKNDTKVLKSIEKYWMESLSFLDNKYVHAILVFIVFVFATRIFYNVNDYVEDIYKYSFVRVVILLLIVYVLPKSPLLSILLAICYALSVRKVGTEEHFEDTVMMKPISSPPVLIKMMQEQEEELSRLKSPPAFVPVEEEEMKPKMRRESFVPNMMSNSSYEKESDSDSDSDSESDSTEVDEPMENFDSNDCLNNTPSSFQPVGNLCSSVSDFQPDSDIQGLQSPSGYLQMSGYALN